VRKLARATANAEDSGSSVQVDDTREEAENLRHQRRTIMFIHANTVRRFSLIFALSLSTLLAAACGTLVGAGVGAAGGAAVGAATGNDPGKSALIGAGIGAAGGAIYDITR